MQGRELECSRRAVVAAGLGWLCARALGGDAGAKPAPWTINRKGSDRCELVLEGEGTRRIRILQLSDTHFGRPDPDHRLRDSWTRGLIRQMVGEHKPDAIVVTGDFLHNDVGGADTSAIEFMNGLDVPWALCFGTIELGTATTSISPADLVRRVRHGLGGSFESEGSPRMAYRVDIRASAEAKAGLTLVGLDTSCRLGNRRVCEAQLAWLKRQVEEDARLGVSSPILVFQHAPTLAFEELRRTGKHEGRFGEGVSFDPADAGTMPALQASPRVRGLFCGMDHLNDAWGEWKGLQLGYAKVTGWSGYGPSDRGGRLIDFDPASQRLTQRVVGSGAPEGSAPELVKRAGGEPARGR